MLQIMSFKYIYLFIFEVVGSLAVIKCVLAQHFIYCPLLQLLQLSNGKCPWGQAQLGNVLFIVLLRAADIAVLFAPMSMEGLCLN